jgi:hypothetical protein
MKRWLLYFWVHIIGVRIFRYRGSRNDLLTVKECIVRSIQNHSIIFNFYEKEETDTTIRYGKVKVNVFRYYVIEAIFSDGFSNDFKQYNEVKYYIDFRSRRFFNRDLVLDILLDKFALYLEHVFSTKNTSSIA